MIGVYETQDDGRLVLLLHRCNRFGDHKSGGLQGKDGDILIVCEQLGRIDHADAEVLIKLIGERLEKSAEPFLSEEECLVAQLGVAEKSCNSAMERLSDLYRTADEEMRNHLKYVCEIQLAEVQRIVGFWHLELAERGRK